MSLQLSRKVILSKLSLRRWIIKKDVLLEQLIQTFNTTEILLLFLQNGLIDMTNLSNKYDYVNPLLWEYGHVLYFWEKMTLDNLGIESNIAKAELYDSFKVSRESRYILQKKGKLLTYEEVKDGFSKIKELIYEYIKEYDLTNVSMYLIRLSQLHQEMHNESFIFTQQLLKIQLYSLPYVDYDYPILYNLSE